MLNNEKLRHIKKNSALFSIESTTLVSLKDMTRPKIRCKQA